MTSEKQVNVFALVMAAGSGTRVGGEIPKQYRLIGGESILSRAIKPLLEHPKISSVTVVISELDESLFRQHCGHLKNISFTFGGKDRQESVRLGLDSLSKLNPEFVLIHDGARPFLPKTVIDDILFRLETEDCVIPVLKINDSLKEAVAGRITGSIDRNQYLRTQTPQGFRYNKIMEAHIAKQGLSLSDDAALLEESQSLATVNGSEDLFKITYGNDLKKAAQFIASNFEYRVGHGFDVHKFGPGKGIILCGVHLPHDLSLIGHSDADVALHAITDALLGALAEGDIGEYFPPSEPEWKDVSSRVFLQKAIELMNEKAGEIVNVDLTIVCELPKIGPFKPRMTQNLSEIFQTPMKNINIKATTTEGLGAMGRKEGISSHASVNVRLPV